VLFIEKSSVQTSGTLPGITCPTIDLFDPIGHWGKAKIVVRDLNPNSMTFIIQENLHFNDEAFNIMKNMRIHRCIPNVNRKIV
jgi:hypothetical protein